MSTIQLPIPLARGPVVPAGRCSRPQQATVSTSVSINLPWKPALDRLIAAILLMPALPLIGLFMLLVRATSRGPGLLRQKRIGQGGKPFTIYKIRTMVIDAEALTGAVWSRPGDPRVTIVGRVLRRLHLDELPQLFNVLKGEMSLVGPRPERPELVFVLSKAVPGYTDRLQVPPGITGLAQLSLPSDVDLDSVRCKLALDLAYIRRASLLLDLQLLFCTCLYAVGIRGGLARRICGFRGRINAIVACFARQFSYSVDAA